MEVQTKNTENVFLVLFLYKRTEYQRSTGGLYMKKRIACACFAALFVCMALTGCKKNVGTPEDNAVIEEMDEADEEEE